VRKFSWVVSRVGWGACGMRVSALVNGDGDESFVSPISEFMLAAGTGFVLTARARQGINDQRQQLAHRGHGIELPMNRA